MKSAMLLIAALAHALAAQSPPIERLRILAARDDVAMLAGAVREHPDDARELVRRLLAELGAARPVETDSALAVARRLAGVYAAAWDDSFPLFRVDRFARLGTVARAAERAADSVRLAGNAALGRDGVIAALRLWRESLRRSSALADTANMAAALGNIGAGFYRAMGLDSAEAYLERARALAAAIGDRRTSTNALGALASVAKDRGDLARAQQLYTRALAIRSRIGDPRGMASDHNNLGLIAQALEASREARAQYEQALSLARLHALPEPEAAALLNLGNLASVDAEYATASGYYADALAVYRGLGDDADAALVLHDLGLLALRRGDYSGARKRLGEALAIYARIGTSADLVQVRRDLASALAAAGDLRGSLQELRQSERLLSGPGRAERAPADYEIAASIALARADLAVQLNDLAEGERQYARAASLDRRAGNDAGVEEAETGTALLLMERGESHRALRSLEATLRVESASADRRPAALTRLLIGYVQLRSGDRAGARHTLQQARDSLHVLGDAVGEAAAQSAIGDLELEDGAPLAAEAAYRRGLARLGSGRGAESVAWQLHFGLGRALHARGALDGASAELRDAVGEIERAAGTLALAERRASFLADKWDVYAELAMVEHARGDDAAAFEIDERARARGMLDVVARGRVAPPPATDSALVEREQDLRRRIDELTRRVTTGVGEVTERRGPVLTVDNGEVPGASREALARAQEEYAQVVVELGEDASEHAAIVRGVVAPWPEVARRLAPDEALVEYLVSDSTTLAFVVRPDTLRVVDLNVGRHTVQSLVDFTRGVIARPEPSTTSAVWRAPLRRLYGYLIAPLQESGALTGTRRLVVVPHVELHYLPFSALIRPGNASRGERDEFLVERYEVRYAPSASVWVRLGERPAGHGDGVLALAPRVDALPGSRDEVDAIRAIYGSGARVLIGDAASEEAFRAAAPRYGIVHLATYGVLNKHNPLFSYVSLNPGAGHDGRLEVHEVFGLALNARLLVLSACQTALGSGAVSDVPAGDDWVGLARAFLGAGVANIIATLWPVEDRSTARFMARLHRGLRAGRSEAAALADAQRQMLRDPGRADPFYWAGFVLVGGR